jgi:hypothetical protein
VRFISVENRDGEPFGVFVICNGPDLDVDVTSTRCQENGGEIPGKVECQYGRDYCCQCKEQFMV